LLQSSEINTNLIVSDTPVTCVKLICCFKAPVVSPIIDNVQSLGFISDTPSPSKVNVPNGFVVEWFPIAIGTTLTSFCPLTENAPAVAGSTVGVIFTSPYFSHEKA
jgi:hypothetical protein